MTTHTAQARGFCHEAFFHAGDDEFLAGAVPFLEAGISKGEAVIAALPEHRRELLRGALGPLAGEVALYPMEEIGRNPARLISAWRCFLRSSADAPGVRGIGEPAHPGRSSAELEECERHEHLVNLMFREERTLTVMCPYDTSALDDEVLAGAKRSHSHPGGPGRESAPEHFTLDGSLPQPDRPTLSLGFGRADLRTVRQAVASLARSVGLSSRRNEDFVLAACEAATNSIQHGGGEGSLAIWRDGEKLVCDIRDAGRITDPLVGRERPPVDQVGGRGLWIANELCDLVQIRSGEQGTHVRLRMEIEG
ncbi:MAG TPA: sensor histidine kinase [Solirubrobacterales bacterium]|nr:sensor histidine kinase [Solirubrobacterales bacterium]